MTNSRADIVEVDIKKHSNCITFDALQLFNFERFYYETGLIYDYIAEKVICGNPSTLKRMYKTPSEKVDDLDAIVMKLSSGFNCLSVVLPERDQPYFHLQNTNYLYDAVKLFLDSPKMKLYYTCPHVEIKSIEFDAEIRPGQHVVPTKVKIYNTDGN